MANAPNMTAEQMQQNLADLTAQNQSILANIQHSNAVGAANEAANMAQTDAFISALEGSSSPASRRARKDRTSRATCRLAGR